MSFVRLFDFLERLQRNNSKSWMDEHRKEYVQVRNFYIDWLDTMNTRLAGIDSDYFDTPGKKAINRINNNLMFHPDRPVYKDHFGAGLDQRSKQGDFYIELGVNQSFMGGGYWHPSSDVLKSIRSAIDYNGEVLSDILNRNSFVDLFGGLVENDQLKTAPKGFSINHEHISLLRQKSFAAVYKMTRQEVMSADFSDKVVEVYKELLPFRKYLNEAVTV